MLTNECDYKVFFVGLVRAGTVDVRWQPIKDYVMSLLDRINEDASW